MVDKNTAEKLIAEHSALLSGLCMSLCKNAVDAQDLYQETWLKILGSDFVYREENSFRTYLMRVCVNAYRDIYRARKHRAELWLDDEKQKYIENIPDKAFPEEDYAYLYDAIGRLSYKHRTALTLFYFRDMTESEMAKVLGIPEGTVKSRIHNAKKALRKELLK